MSVALARSTGSLRLAVLAGSAGFFLLTATSLPQSSRNATEFHVSDKLSSTTLSPVTRWRTQRRFYLHRFKMDTYKHLYTQIHGVYTHSTAVPTRVFILDLRLPDQHPTWCSTVLLEAIWCLRNVNVVRCSCCEVGVELKHGRVRAGFSVCLKVTLTCSSVTHICVSGKTLCSFRMFDVSFVLLCVCVLLLTAGSWGGSSD